MAKILLIEDELLIAESTSALLTELGHETVGICCTEKDSHSAFKTLSFDLAMIDVNLDGNNEGIALGRILSNMNKPFIYLTSYSDPETLELAKATKPSAYIVKPADRVDLFTNLEIVLAREIDSASQNTITLRDGYTSIIVNTNEIHWLKADHIYVEIKLEKRTIIQRLSMRKMMAKLNGSNIHRTHRSWAVNLDHIKSVTSDHLVIDDVNIPISASYRSNIRKMIKG